MPPIYDTMNGMISIAQNNAFGRSIVAQHYDNVNAAVSLSSHPQVGTTPSFDSLIFNDDFSTTKRSTDASSLLMAVLNLNPGTRSERIDAASEKEGIKSRTFAHGSGEIDMLIGFFVMNGACIAFFLLFGSCVICSCLRGLSSNGNGLLKSATARSGPLSTSTSRSSFQQLIPSPVPRKTFKSIFSKAFRKGDKKVNNGRSNGISNDFRKAEPLQKRNSVLELHGTTAYHSPIKIRIDNPSDCDNSATGRLLCSSESLDPAELERPSLIRQNLLGPLSFDDLYYT